MVGWKEDVNSVRLGFLVFFSPPFYLGLSYRFRSSFVLFWSSSVVPLHFNVYYSSVSSHLQLADQYCILFVLCRRLNSV